MGGRVSGTANVSNFSSWLPTASAVCHCRETDEASSLHLAKLQHGQLLLRAVESQGADTHDALPFTVLSHPSGHTCKCLCVFPFRLIGFTSSKYSDVSDNPFVFATRSDSPSGLYAISNTRGNANDARQALWPLPFECFDTQKTSFFLSTRMSFCTESLTFP